MEPQVLQSPGTARPLLPSPLTATCSCTRKDSCPGLSRSLHRDHLLWPQPGWAAARVLPVWVTETSGDVVCARGPLLRFWLPLYLERQSSPRCGAEEAGPFRPGCHGFQAQSCNFSTDILEAEPETLAALPACCGSGGQGSATSGLLPRWLSRPRLQGLNWLRCCGHPVCGPTRATRCCFCRRSRDLWAGAAVRNDHKAGGFKQQGLLLC